MNEDIFVLVLSLNVHTVMAQGCSDAGVCTIGDRYNHPPNYARAVNYKHELDISFTYATHGRNERFYQPQFNYRYKQNSQSFIELRIPLNIANANSITVTGIGDLTATWNSQFRITKKNSIKYAVGLRASLTSADKHKADSAYSYGMELQNGLGTTDLLAALCYDLGKYISFGTGVQMPLMQYNKNRLQLDPNSFPYTIENYRRKPDALLKITGHYAWDKLKLNTGLLAIFHLGNDHYTNPMWGKYVLEGSKGTTLNWTADINYAFTKQWMFGLLYARPFQTRKNIPDGLARTMIINAKLTYSFR
jgi:hypothetical protein